MKLYANPIGQQAQPATLRNLMKNSAFGQTPLKAYKFILNSIDK